MIYGLSQSENWRVIIAENEIRAREIYDDYRLFDKSVMYYPPKDIIFWSGYSGKCDKYGKIESCRCIVKK